MKKIGLIDYYIDNWHAGQLPGWLKDETNGEYQICYAYASWDPKADVRPESEGKCSTAEWCERHGVEQCASAQEVVDKSDVLLVLSPNNAEQHEELCREALASGKRTYVDKTFAPDGATAERILRYAAEHGTPMFSTSSLRFSTELLEVKKEGIRVVATKGAGVYANYSIHQIEMIVTLMGADAKRVMAIGTPKCPALAIEFSGGRYATMGQFASGCPFAVSIAYDDGTSVNIQECTDFFANFVHELVDFFEGGEPKAPADETIMVAKIIETGREALKEPGVWKNI